MTEAYREVIGDLLNNADPLAKKVVSAYRYDATYNSNLESFRKFDAKHLEAAATLLGYTVRGDNKKLYKNLKILSDRILLKIEALFETHCNDCGEEYTNKLDDEPLLSCQVCLQGSHNCDKVQERFDALNEVPENLRLLGMVWLCSGCLKKNSLTLMPAQTPSTSENPAEIVEREQTEEEEEVEEEAESLSVGERESSRRNRPAQQSNDQEICSAYKFRNCPHGLTGKKLINGKPCEKRHPPRCFRYCKHGDNKRLGCVKGKNCNYYHPRICKDSLTKRECFNKECKFDHLKFTRRKKEDTQKDEVPQVQVNKTGRKMRFDSYASLTTPYPPTIKQSYANAAHPIKSVAVEEPSAFLLQLLENMKEGIIGQMSEKISELQASLPIMVQEQIRHSTQLTQGFLPHVQPMQSMTRPQTAQFQNSQSLPSQYPGYFC